MLKILAIWKTLIDDLDLEKVQSEIKNYHRAKRIWRIFYIKTYIGYRKNNTRGKMYSFEWLDF